MTHKQMRLDQPTAIITVNGSEKKVYNSNTIYLKKGDNFEIRLFNPTNEKIGAEIIFNNQKKSNSLLILRPGEDATIDRYLDDNKKMLFDTYDVDPSNEQAVKAIQNNGLIEIKFYKEIVYQGYTTTWINTGGFYNQPYNQPWTTCGTSSTASGTFTTTNNVNYSSSNRSMDGLFYCSCDLSDAININANLNESKLETGRIEKGENSNQEFDYDNTTKFQSYSFHSIKYQLKPESTMPKENIRLYCSSCGYRLRDKSWKFCPKCSNKVE